MDEETKANIKMGIIFLVVFGGIMCALYFYNVAHKADPNHDKEFSKVE